MRKELLQNRLDRLKIEYQEALITNDRNEVKRLYGLIHETVKELEEAKADEIIQKAKESGMFKRTDRLVSLTQLLMCEANNILSEIEEEFKAARIMTDKTALMQREYYKAADLYFNEFAKIVKHNNKTNDMFSDLEEFDNLVRVFADLKEMPKPVSLMVGCKQAASKANGLSHMCQKCMMTPNPESIMCRACSKSFREGFQKGAKWLEKKRIERIMKKDKEDSNEKRRY